MTLEIETALRGLRLVQLDEHHAVDLHDLLQRNRAHLTVRGDYTEIVSMSAQDIASELRARQAHDLRMGLFYLQQLVGRVDLNSPKLGTFVLGYWVDATHTTRGFAKAGRSAIIEYSQRTLGAEEVWAGVIASNSASISVLEHLGFRLVETLSTHLRYRLSLRSNEGAV